MLFRGQKGTVMDLLLTKDRVGTNTFWEKTLEYTFWTKQKDLKRKKRKFSSVCGVTKTFLTQKKQKQHFKPYYWHIVWRLISLITTIFERNLFTWIKIKQTIIITYFGRITVISGCWRSFSCTKGITEEKSNP